MDLLVQIILATIAISLISLSGAVLFIFNEKKVNKYLILIVAFAAGSFLGTSFFHLIPESVELFYNTINIGSDKIFFPSYFILLGILLFYIIEKFIHWHHHHDIDCHKHSISTLSLIGDGFHNFIDGALIATAFFVDLRLGIITTIAIAMHEIPQEIGDLAILLHSGISKKKALFFNFISALMAVIGSIIMYLIIEKVEIYIPYLVAFVAGTFIYLSLADIVPELNKKSHNFSQALISLLFLLGIIFSFLMTFIL